MGPGLNPYGETKTHLAVNAASDVLTVENIGRSALRPVVILITDGHCTSEAGEYDVAIDRLKRRLMGNGVNSSAEEKVTRMAIGIGNSINIDELKRFASTGIVYHVAENGKEYKEEKPLVFHSKDDSRIIASCINWGATTSLVSSIHKQSKVVYFSQDLRDKDIEGW